MGSSNDSYFINAYQSGKNRDLTEFKAGAASRAAQTPPVRSAFDPGCVKTPTFAEERLAAVVQAKELLKRLPGAAALGPAGLFELGRRLATEKQLRLSRPRDSGEARLCTQP
jgi:hypothetical protein